VGLPVSRLPLIFRPPIPKKEGRTLWPFEPGGISTAVNGVIACLHCGPAICRSTFGFPLPPVASPPCGHPLIHRESSSSSRLPPILHKLLPCWQRNVGPAPSNISPGHPGAPVPQGKKSKAGQGLPPAPWRSGVSEGAHRAARPPQCPPMSCSMVSHPIPKDKRPQPEVVGNHGVVRLLRVPFYDLAFAHILVRRRRQWLAYHQMFEALGGGGQP